MQSAWGDPAGGIGQRARAEAAQKHVRIDLVFRGWPLLLLLLDEAGELHDLLGLLLGGAGALLLHLLHELVLGEELLDRLRVGRDLVHLRRGCFGEASQVQGGCVVVAEDWAGQGLTRAAHLSAWCCSVVVGTENGLVR